MARKVAGLDLSMTATGVAHTSTDDTGCTHLIRPPGRGDYRLVGIKDQVMAFVAGSETVLIEGWLVRSASAPVTGMVHGAVREALIEVGLPYGVVPPATLKKYATGRGNCDKTAMALAAYKRAGLEFQDDNQCDAWWLWVMARDLTGDPVLDLPKIQRESLSKVTMDRKG
jgi:Holliday junction resolvasome RuvABC endonuclease subunit